MARKKGTKQVQANKKTYDGIKFASGLEVFAYKTLKEAGLCGEGKLLYEGKTFEIVKPFEYDGKKYRNIKITPDFVDETNKVIFEVKGRPNESFPMRWKLMKKYFHDKEEEWKIFYGVGNQKNVREEIDKIVEHYENSGN